MKKMIIAAAVALTGSFALAGALDVPAPLPVGGQKITFPYCKDGAQATFVEQNAVGRTIYVTRTCTNGRWYPKTNPKIIKCQEGATAVWSVARPGLDRYDNVTYVCHDGKWVPNN
jgi:hypothetical protein